MKYRNAFNRATCLLLFSIQTQPTLSWTYVEPFNENNFPLGIVYLEMMGTISSTCTGSLISNHTIITAGHCLDQFPTKIHVRLNRGYQNTTRCRKEDQFWSPDKPFCVLRKINLKTSPASAIQHPNYVKSAEQFFKSKNTGVTEDAEVWLSNDIGIITVEQGFFKSREAMKESIFYLARSKKTKDRYLWGAGYGKVKPELGRQRKARTLLPRGGPSKRISTPRMAAELIQELRYHKANNVFRNIRLETLLNYPSGSGVKFPDDYLTHVGIWGMPGHEPSQYEISYKNDRDDRMLPNYRPTMCYGDSGGPTFVKKKGIKHKNRTYKVLKAVNSIMDDLCQQFMIGSSISSNKAWILENIQNKEDLVHLTKSNRKRRTNRKKSKEVAN